MKIIVVNGIEYKVEVILKKRNKKTYMRVKDDVIVITTPLKMSDNMLTDLIKRNIGVISKLITKKSIEDNSIHYLGVKYNLVLKKSTNNLVYIYDNEFIVEYIKESDINKNIVKFYKDGLILIVNQYKDDIFGKFNLKNTEIFYKYVKTFFGKCYTKQNKICLNIRLAKYDIKYILSVIYHECAHFKVPNHQKEYYRHLESIYPNYRRVQKELRSINYNEKY
jgi:predicted metal-dependent hydrolase